jgi:L-ascorbate metabolism protein UlaG (beta-lactamase superfamily)
MRRHTTAMAVLLSCLVAYGTFQCQAAPAFRRTQKSPSELLQSRLGKGEAIIWHLHRSGFALKTAHHLLIFDYWPGPIVPPNGRGLAFGFVDPEEIKGEDIIVFISHHHSDHFYAPCLAWQDKVKTIRYVVSPEVFRMAGHFTTRLDSITSIGPYETADIKDVQVKTLKATDAGVAFLVKTDGLTIYHSGDHACWKCEDPEAESRFVTELLKPLEGEKIDIAMQAFDPRVKASGWGGIGAFALKYKPRLLVPMHFGPNYEERNDIEAYLKSIKTRSSFWVVQGRGDCVIYQRKQ